MTRPNLPAPAKKPKKLPVKWSPDVAERIADATAEGQPLTDICQQPGMPNKKTVYRWMDAYPEFQRAMTEARRVAAEHYFGEIAELKDRLKDPATDYKTARSYTSAIEALKWMAAKCDPTRYGDKAAMPVMAVQINTTLDLGDSGKPTIDGSNVYKLSVPQQAASDGGGSPDV